MSGRSSAASSASATGRGGGSAGRGRGNTKGRGKTGGRGPKPKANASVSKETGASTPSLQTDSSGNANKALPTKDRGGSGRENRTKPNPVGSKTQGNQKRNTPNPPTLSPKDQQRHQEIEKHAQEVAAEKARAVALARAQAAAIKVREQKQADVDQKVREARDLLQNVINATHAHQRTRADMEPETLQAFRKTFQANKKNLKTDLKKCATFVKKVKSGVAWSMKPEDIVKDVSTLNLSRYVEEVANGILESSTKPKVSELPSVLSLVTTMHQRYEDFLSMLVPALWKVVNAKPTPAMAKLRRLYVRILTELVLNGIVTETKPLIACVTDASGANASQGTNCSVQDANLMVAFSKAAGFELLDIVPTSVHSAIKLIGNYNETEACTPDGADAIFPSQDVIKQAYPVVEQIPSVLTERAVAAQVSEVLVTHCRAAYHALSTNLTQTHRKLLQLEKRCEQDRLLSGSLTEAREKGLVDARKLQESLQKAVDALADVVDERLPILQQQEEDGDADGSGGLEVWTKGTDGEEDLGPFDDEEMRTFYCDVPDLLTTTPPALLGLAPEAIESRKLDNQRKYGAEGEVVDEGDDGTELPLGSQEEFENEEDEELKDEEDPEIEEQKDTPHYRLMVLLEEELPECHRREQLDELTEKFCTNHGSSKNSRKRLSRTLFLVPRSRLDLLPYYSRMAATVDRVWTDIASPLVADLEHQFHGQAKFKKNQNIESRMKTARYIGELTKFRVAPPIVFLRCLKRCLEDFTGNNVDVTCCLLESCGRFLFRLKHTSGRIATLMETITRLSKAKNLDERHQSLIQAAFYAVKPPPSGPRKQQKEYPPLEAYVRYLLMVRLEPTDMSVSFTAKELIRLPWSDPEQQCGALVCRIMLKACRKGRYRTIYAIAAVADRLRPQRSACEAPVRLVDALLEELRWALEHPDFRDQQRTITYARLLGELYCSSQVTGQLVINQLYDFINIGHEIPNALREASQKLAASQGEESGEQLPLFTSMTGVSQTIKEDEEMEDDNLDAAEQAPAPPTPVAVSQHSKYDPRVPSLEDPPNASYRVKLVCTVLEVVAKSIMSRSVLPRMRGFLAAFQRYLFTKTTLPTDVEFSLLDTFDILDSQWKRFTRTSRDKELEEGSESGFPRYSSWLDAHNVTMAFEESDALLELQKRNHVETLADESKTLGDLHVSMDAHSLNDDSASLLEDEEDDASLSVSAKGSVAEDTNDDETESGDSDEDYEGVTEDDIDSESGGNSEEEEEEFDEEAYMRQLEEEAFERELRRVTIEALEKGKNTSRKLVAENMVSGSQTFKKKPTDLSKPVGASSAVAPTFGRAGTPGITFQLLKKGNKGKVEAKEIVVPSDTNFAKVASKQDDAAARERNFIKQRVLQYEADSAEAELSGGNVYLEQERLQVIRNRPLSMDDIDRNFGTRGGNTLQSGKDKGRTGAASGDRPGTSVILGQRGGGRGGPGRGRGGRGNTSGRTLFRG